MSIDKLNNPELFTNADYVCTTEEIIDFLEKKGCNHRGGYYHYTTLSALNGMLQSKKVHLSIGSDMNDILETKKCNPERWKKIYVASFSFGMAENMAMWGIYGDPFHEALRIRFSCYALNKVMDSVSKNANIPKKAEYSPEDKKYKYDSIPNMPKYAAKLVDVVYYHGGSLERDRKYIRQKNYPNVRECWHNDAFTGYLKNEAWFYENETRLIIEFESELPEVKTIAIDFTEGLKTFDVISGPCLSSQHAKEQITSISESKFNIKDSSHYGLVHFRKRCMRCPNESEKSHIFCPYRSRFRNGN